MRSHDALRLNAPVLYGSKPSAGGRSSVSCGLSSTSIGARSFFGFFAAAGFAAGCAGCVDAEPRAGVSPR
jgi:hypothetical protein